VVLASLKELVEFADETLKVSYEDPVWLDRLEEVLWGYLYNHRRYVRPQILDYCTQQQRGWLEQAETRLERTLEQVEEAVQERQEQAGLEAKDELAKRRRAHANWPALLEGAETG
jgi:hypothetical protein